MFFYIGDKNPLKSLNKITDRLFLDDGWLSNQGTWYKGYSTDCVLSESLDAITNGYQPAGKWCVIKDDTVFHPVLRGFPLYTSGNNITNLPIGYSLQPYHQPVVDISLTPAISIDDAADMIGNILLENTINFFKYNDIPQMNVLFSGGLDTLTAWAVLDSYKKDYILNIHLRKPEDKTIQDTLGIVRDYTNDVVEIMSKNHWGYEISSVYNDLNWYVTGYYAEVFHYRDIVALNILANNLGKRVFELATVTDYLYWFLLRKSTIDSYINRPMIRYDNEIDLKQALYKSIFHDYQMWHNGNNMTFSPFFDIRIPLVMLQLSVEDITKNSLNGIIQRRVVERFNPRLLPLLSAYKNEKGVMDNFEKNWASVSPTLSDTVTVNIH